MSKTPTPGPWVIFSCDGVYSVMPAMREGDIATGITVEADAVLIAASLDLLDALIDLRDAVKSGGYPHNEMRRANNAIAKAQL